MRRFGSRARARGCASRRGRRWWTGRVRCGGRRGRRATPFSQMQINSRASRYRAHADACTCSASRTATPSALSRASAQIECRYRSAGPRRAARRDSRTVRLGPGAARGPNRPDSQRTSRPCLHPRRSEDSVLAQPAASCASSAAQPITSSRPPLVASISWVPSTTPEYLPLAEHLSFSPSNVASTPPATFVIAVLSVVPSHLS